MQLVDCQIDKVTQLNQFIHQIEMKPNKEVEFKPGQYLKLMLDDDKKTPFSIANTASKKNLVIQVGHTLGSPLPDAIDFCKNNSQIQIEAGLGNAYFQSAQNQPIILFAGGTGFSYIKSIADHLRESNHQADVYFYWGLRTQDTIYAKDEMEQWANSNKNFHFIPVIKSTDNSWQGRTGCLLNSVLADKHQLSKFDIYLAGRFDLMPHVRSTLIEQGAHLNQMYSDAFAYI